MPRIPRPVWFGLGEEKERDELLLLRFWPRKVTLGEECMRGGDMDAVELA